MRREHARARVRPGDFGALGEFTQLALCPNLISVVSLSRHSRVGDYPYGATTSELPGNLHKEGPSSAAQNFESVKVGCDGWQRHVRPSHHRKRCSSRLNDAL